MCVNYGYIRVSSKDQNIARQADALARYSIAKNNIYTDKQSGKDFMRPAWKKLMSKLKKGDILYVKSIDRLGRNYEDILEQWRLITKEKQANISVLDMPLLNTTSGDGDLTNTFIADLVLQILSYVAQQERESIKRRQAEGIASAKARGIKFGRRKMCLEGLGYQYELWHKGKTTTRQAAKELGISHMTFYRRCMEIRNDNIS